ncbi:MAG: tRNA (adenosine(37)-N6)-threonylcarbamoyltransferase complex dimerization subunit type 1 TsaB [Nitrospiraceae bacterium]|nr:MAG: tRNA (adenosine(37)-N6)-threonylcarbamoyltransferase complex dimerization subunit type 1 TsaB [Nitrospiraceae bacterium]UCH46164.1 MAG: tRNA (adenosine(37)-N6)-threonylcarbamoyltransferase complex dimerization subunit type 1 TsaB [Nitrospiraceae bacterium]
MKILALETATLSGSVAIVDSETGLISEVTLSIKVAHSERLMPSIQWMLQASGLSFNDIDVYAVSIGPGSFTGLRIGISTVKGLAYATGRPVVAVHTLDAFARALPLCAHFVCPVLDARKNEVYAALYKWNGPVCEKRMDECALGPADLVRELSGNVHNEKVVFLGEGAMVYKDFISEAMHSQALFAPQTVMTPSAAGVAEIAMEKLKNGDTQDPVTLTPLYIRKSEAEIRWKG